MTSFCMAKKKKIRHTTAKYEVKQETEKIFVIYMGQFNNRIYKEYLKMNKRLTP